jgi:AraC-like DNA-binding protein
MELLEKFTRVLGFKMKNIPVRNIRVPVREPGLSGNFSIRKVDELVGEQDMVQELHRHSFYHILVLNKGQGTHTIDFTAYPVTDHSIYFMRPGQVHQISLKQGSSGFLIQFNSDFYHPGDKTSALLLKKAGKINYYQLSPAIYQKLDGLLTNITGEYAGKQEGYTEVITSSIGIFFIELTRLQGGITGSNANVYMQERLEELLHLLEINIISVKQVSEYASMMSLSPYQLNAISKETIGKTCSQLINEYIILEAKRQLLATSNQVNQVADYLGYEDVSYFIRFFKKQTGYSPESFRSKFK